MGTDTGFWRDRPVLVTGATGFLGSHVVGLLQTAGAAVISLVRDEVPPLGPVAGASVVVRGDIRDQALCERVLGDYEVQTVLHLAAQSQVQVANANPAETLDSNVRGTWTLLEAVRRSPTVGQVVVASSDKAYGSQSQLPYTEDMALLAANPYDVSKACADAITTMYAAVFDVPVCVTRCGNLFGPGDRNWARIVPSAMRSLLRGERPVVRSDGTPLRDYLYVVDAAAGYLQLVEAMAADLTVIGEAFNLSADQPLSVLELMDIIIEATGVTGIAPDVQGRAVHEIADQHLSSAKARSRFGWQTTLSLAEALAVTAEWYRRELSSPTPS